MSNLGHDPPDDTTDQNSLWRVGLYRMVVVSFSIFATLFFHILIPHPTSSSSQLKRSILTFLQHVIDFQVPGRDFINAIEFAIFDYPIQKTYSRAELIARRQVPNVDHNILIELLTASWSINPAEDSDNDIISEYHTIHKQGIENVRHTSIKGKARALMELTTVRNIDNAKLTLNFVRPWIRIQDALGIEDSCMVP